MLKADIIVDLQAGDTGKGKVAHALAKKPNYYTHVVRYNGGGNAGHTVYHNGKKFVTHYIPVGVLYGIKSIIGPGCVVDPDKLDIEIAELENAGFVVRGNLFIDKRVHIITPENILEDSKDTKIGTTKTGNGPTYRNKYDRKGLRAEDFYTDDCLIDIYREFHQHQPNAQILFEGAQGFELDIDWGDYPYVTSSHCTVGSAIMNGVPPQSINRVYGIAKAYSYFGTIVKRWCIIYNNKMYKNKVQKVAVDELNNDHNQAYTLDSTPVDDKLSIFMDQYVNEMTTLIHTVFSKEQDIKIADSILELFRKRDLIDVFNKKALYIYIYEMVPDIKAPRITKVANVMYDIFKKNYTYYLDHNYIEFTT